MNYQGKSFMLFSFWSCEFLFLFFIFFMLVPLIWASFFLFFLLLFFFWLSISLFANYNIEKKPPIASYLHSICFKFIYALFVLKLFMLCLYVNYVMDRASELDPITMSILLTIIMHVCLPNQNKIITTQRK